MFIVVCKTCSSRIRVHNLELTGQIHPCPRCGGMVQLQNSTADQPAQISDPYDGDLGESSTASNATGSNTNHPNTPHTTNSNSNNASPLASTRRAAENLQHGHALNVPEEVRKPASPALAENTPATPPLSEEASLEEAEKVLAASLTSPLLSPADSHETSPLEMTLPDPTTSSSHALEKHSPFSRRLISFLLLGTSLLLALGGIYGWTQWNAKKLAKNQPATTTENLPEKTPDTNPNIVSSETPAEPLQPHPKEQPRPEPDPKAFSPSVPELSEPTKNGVSPQEKPGTESPIKNSSPVTISEGAAPEPEQAEPTQSESAQPEPAKKATTGLDPLAFNPSEVDLAIDGLGGLGDWLKKEESATENAGHSTSPKSAETSAATDDDKKRLGIFSGLSNEPEKANPPGSLQIRPQNEKFRTPSRMILKKRLAAPLRGIRVEKSEFAQVLDLISNYTNIPIIVSPDLVQLIKTKYHHEVQITATDTTAKELLEKLLEKRSLSYRFEPGLLILTYPGGEKKRQLKYQVKDLIEETEITEEQLATILKTVVVSPHLSSLDSQRLDLKHAKKTKPPQITHQNQEFEVLATTAQHYRLLRLLAQWRQAVALPIQGKYPKRQIPTTASYAKAYQTLATPTTFTFVQWQTFREAIGYWEKNCGMNIVVDWKALAQQKIMPRTDLLCAATNEPWSVFFSRALTPIGLTWRVLDEKTLEITSQKVAQSEYQVDFYKGRGDLLQTYRKTLETIGPLVEVTEAFGPSHKTAPHFYYADEKNGLFLLVAPAAYHHALGKLLVP